MCREACAISSSSWSSSKVTSGWLLPPTTPVRTRSEREDSNIEIATLSCMSQQFEQLTFAKHTFNQQPRANSRKDV